MPLSQLVGGFLQWDAFVDELRERNRYSPSASAEYVEDMLAQCAAHTHRLPAGTRVYRARRMPLEAALETDPLPLEEMGPPPRELARSGRLNPEGIAYFYLSLESDTCIAEVRPWIHARVSVATFELSADIDVFDLRMSAAAASEAAHSTLAYILQRPTYPQDEDRWAYLGTQYVAERLKLRSLAGIIYDSGLRADGLNLALFEDRACKRVGVELVEVTSVLYAHSNISPHRFKLSLNADEA